MGSAQARLTLASTSPQRRAILEQLRIPFDVSAPVYEEHDPPDADPVETREWLDALGGETDVTAVPGNHDAYVASTWPTSRRSTHSRTSLTGRSTSCSTTPA